MKQFLHIGCGQKNKTKTTLEFAKDEWFEVRFDIDESVKPDIVGTMTDMTCVDSESMDAIFSSHNIEHLYPHEVQTALNEFFRVLKKDGFLVITCPDLQSVCKLIADDKLLEPAYNSPAGPISPIDILYGHRPSLQNGNLYMAHKCGFTKRALIGTLQSSGFKSIASIQRSHPYYDLWAIGIKTTESEENIKKLAFAHFPRF